MAVIIAQSERTTVARGRKPKINPALAEVLRADNLPVDALAVLGADEGIEATEAGSSERSSVVNTVRSHWKHVGRGPDGTAEPVSIRFTPEGFPQVGVNLKKLAEKQAAEEAAAAPAAKRTRKAKA